MQAIAVVPRNGLLDASFITFLFLIAGRK